ncbi:dynamin family protein [Paraburkholderia sp. J11-2]|uniref:dynamin family protein n=1 Tax=Paraburkholderia sp. J11-2 TaxID=2805431 RepID=UPI002AB79919|nr:dynamin family protein [Paraburkholderia sp. J11-2]
MDLREYENAKFELAGMLRTLSDATRDMGEPVAAQIRDLFVRLAEDRFNLAVVGRFGRGKSSLMNALIGVERLPTGILPLTAVITAVVYGSTEKVVIHYEGRRLSTEITLEELPQFITQRANPGNMRGVKTAEVQLPAELLRRGFHFVDTPGLGSAIAENTRTTESFLPEADAMLVVTSYDSPMSEEEFAVLRLAARYDRRVFMVLNKQDTVTQAQREEGLAYVNEQLQRVLGPRASPPFPVSAQDGLAAKSRCDRDALRESGVAALEDALVAFLLEGKRRAFLASFCERVQDVARRMPMDARLAAVALDIQNFRTRLEADRATVSRSRTVPSIDIELGSLQNLQPCEICERIQSVSFDFLCHYQYELSVSPQSQDRHAQARGLCVTHTRQLAVLASPRGVAIGYPALLGALSATLERAARAAEGGIEDLLDRKDVLPDAHECELCRLCMDTLHTTIAEIAGRLAQDPAHAVDALSGICMLHLPALIAGLGDVRLMQGVLAREAAILSRLADDLRRYATKHDAIRRQLASAEETEAAEKTLKLIAGLVNVHVPWADG